MADTKAFVDVTDRRVLDKLVPVGSPHYVQMQALVIDIISLVPDNKIDLLCSISCAAATNFQCIDCTEIILQVVGKGKTEEWAVTYMLIAFYQAYGAVDNGSDAWQFMSGYLKIMFMIAARQDKHFAKIDKLGVRIRMALRPADPQRDILNELIRIHDQCDNLSSCLSSIRKYEISVKQEEATGKAANQYLASKVGQIRLAYEVVINKPQYQTTQLSKAKNSTKPISPVNKAR
ncbi:hypothetical protein [uncultured Psychrobacter sp.]|uniref:hypothetical protein n=1 Tax=uncultured Psychrobacter sp. TaxID=259303 RepID=UPI002631DEF3|nr:hypothetical protein [uncultured Psychrobacter sp.]